LRATIGVPKACIRLNDNTYQKILKLITEGRFSTLNDFVSYAVMEALINLDGTPYIDVPPSKIVRLRKNECTKILFKLYKQLYFSSKLLEVLSQCSSYDICSSVDEWFRHVNGLVKEVVNSNALQLIGRRCNYNEVQEVIEDLQHLVAPSTRVDVLDYLANIRKALAVVRKALNSDQIGEGRKIRRKSKARN